MSLLGIKVISVTQQLGDINDPSTFMLELITAGMGQLQVLDTRQKSVVGVAEKAKKEEFLGGYPPFGYIIEDKNYVIYEPEAKTIRSLYAAGKSYERILS